MSVRSRQTLKISAVGMWTVQNYGAVLVAYATQRLFIKHGFDFEYVNCDPFVGLPGRAGFRDYVHYFKHCVSDTSLRKIINIIIHIIPNFRSKCIKKERLFNEFIDAHLNISKTDYSQKEYLLYETPPKADVYLCGGDQLWNISLVGRLSKFLFLGFAPGEKPKYSFSTSICNNDFPEESKPKVRRLLERFDRISVRGNSGKEAIEALGIQNVEELADPVLLLKDSDWEKLAAPRIVEEPYVLVYQLGTKLTGFGKEPLELAKRLGMELIRIERFGLLKIFRNGKKIMLPSPGEFLSLIKYAECIVTNSFHGVAFSIVYGKNFIPIKKHEGDARFHDILNLLGFDDRVYQEGDLYDIYSRDIDWNMVQQRIHQQRNMGEAYIDQIKSKVLAQSRDVNTLDELYSEE